MNEISKVLDKAKKDKDYIDLIATNFLEFTNASNLGIPKESILSEIKEYFKSHSYNPDPKGLEQARIGIAQYYKEEGLDIDKEEIIITASTSESYSQIFNNLTETGQEVLFPNPSYPLFEYLAKYSKITPKFYMLGESNQWGIDINQIEKSISKDTKGIVLISPNNPTGSILTIDELEQIEELAEKHNLFIIFDEVFSEFRKDKIFPRPTGKHNTNIFILNGISKMLALPDLKLAWISVLGPYKEKIVDMLETSNDTYLNATYLTQYILPTLLNYREDIAKNINEVLNSNREILRKFYSNYPERFEGIIGTGGIHHIMKINTSLRDEQIVLKLLQEKKLSVHPGYFYDIAPTNKSSHIVISLLKENKVFEKTLQALAEISSL